MKYLVFFVLGFLLLSPGYAASADNQLQSVKEHFDNVLGTSVDIELRGVTASEADSAINNMLVEIKRLELILSVWQKDSQLSRLNRSRQLADVSQELLQVVILCEQWRDRSQNLFSCRMGKIEQQWKQAQDQQVIPDRVALRYLARDINRQTVKIDTALRQIALDDLIELDPAGLAKGYIIDALSQFLRNQLPRLTGLKIDIGGDALYWQAPGQAKGWTVEIAQPGEENDNHLVQQGRARVLLSSAAIAASGHSSRFYQIERRHFSHILDPREGWPMDNAPSAVVIASNATTADAVATALSTQPAVRGIDWVNSLQDVEAMIMLPDGKKLASNGWQLYMLADKEASQSSSIGSLKIDYQIPNISSLEYHKPYVAMWLTDTNDNIIRNLLVLGESSRWARENTRWWRKVGRRDPDLLDGLARPTRLPGHYQLSWDGLDDYGHPVTGNEFILQIEAAREDGGHDYQRIPLKFTQLSATWESSGTGEIGALKLTYQALPSPF